MYFPGDTCCTIEKTNIELNSNSTLYLILNFWYRLHCIVYSNGKIIIMMIE